MSAPKTALLFIDIQENMLSTPGGWHVPESVQTQFLANAEAVLTRARNEGLPIYHVQHHSTDPEDIDGYGTPGWQLRFPPLPHEVVKHKSVLSIFEANPGFADELRAAGIDKLLTSGLQSEMCVRAASLGGLANGFDVALLSGAHATLEAEEEGSKKAGEISAEIEKELAGKGVKVLDFDGSWDF
ncbi:hypothetical protein V8E36_001179 [Tilletia maclaganii]